MPDSSPRSTSPWWVRFALWGHRSRASVRVAFWACLLVAIAGSFLGFFVGKHYAAAGVLMLLGAWWHARAIAWVDRAEGWKNL